MQVLLLDRLETAPTIATSEMRAATTLLRLALQVQNNRCVCVSDVVVVVTVVVVLAMVFVVIVVVAAVVVDVVLFGCESRSGAHTVLVSGCKLFVLAVLSLVVVVLGVSGPRGSVAAPA